MSGVETEELTRLRKPRFSYEENQILIQEVRANYGRLFGSQSRRVTVAQRRQVWEDIAVTINRITSWRCTGQEVQKHWNDFKRRTKEKLARVPHSTQGGGSANCNESYSAEEETIGQLQIGTFSISRYLVTLEILKKTQLHVRTK